MKYAFLKLKIITALIAALLLMYVIVRVIFIYIVSSTAVSGALETIKVIIPGSGYNNYTGGSFSCPPQTLTASKAYPS